MSARLPAEWLETLDLPLIAAPMFLVSSIDLVAAACENGVIGAIPTVNARSLEHPRSMARLPYEAPGDGAARGALGHKPDRPPEPTSVCRTISRSA